MWFPYEISNHKYVMKINIPGQEKSKVVAVPIKTDREIFVAIQPGQYS
jgi:hypothetical protein